MGLVITPRWGLLGETYHKPRAVLGANDLRTFGAGKSRKYRLIFSFWVSHRTKQEDHKEKNSNHYTLLRQSG